MAFNILDAAKSFITPDLIGQAAGYLQESESSVGKAVSGLLPASLLGITQKAEAGGGNMIFDLAKQAMNSGILGNLGNAFNSMFDKSRIVMRPTLSFQSPGVVAKIALGIERN